ncbi:ribosome biogenesis GTPase Der [Neomegalonema perideroedes]|uniref:ribosome biogenesis GTPase Der n=1 Tax=Neomegalonema perideroedes TaxID=217219 RepID=UPI00037E4D86|nr:ribosome biogenesis GTPase Der [Neomegalonema perideroedes]
MFTLAIVGRPNVGKSTLFNRLVGKRLALVDDQPGVTRDLREGEARLMDLRFVAMDTPGLEEADDASIQGRMRRQTEKAVDMADACLFVVDARSGLAPADHIFAEILRKRARKVILAANKAESVAAELGASEAYALGLGEPIPISGEHALGMRELRDALAPWIEAYEAEQAEAEAEAAEMDSEFLPDLEEENFDPDQPEPPEATRRPLQIAVIGRPNAGKSTLVNAILGEERQLTGPEAGVTRDAIGFTLDWGGRKVKIFDTAGMRRKARIDDRVEKMSVADGLRAVRFAEVIVALLDAGAPFEQQDLRLIDLAAREGRAVVVAVNKWDLVEDRQETLRTLKEELDRLLPQIRGVPLITLSAETGQGIGRLREAIFRARDVWATRISTGKLNRWLRSVIDHHPPPAVSGRRLKIRYATQIRSRPPTFVLFSSRPDEIPDSYIRYLINNLRADFNMPGTPIRMQMRGGDNPYVDENTRS